MHVGIWDNRALDTDSERLVRYFMHRLPKTTPSVPTSGMSRQINSLSSDLQDEVESNSLLEGEVGREATSRENRNSAQPLNPSANLLKWIALVALVVQNSGLAIVMRYTFLLASATHDRYIPSTAVLNAEILKLAISAVACFVFDCQQSQEKFINMLHTEMFIHYRDFVKLFVPSILYTVQNSLQYFSMQCLSAPVFQVLYQMKIITTAMFSVLLLAKRLSSVQWGSIVALTLGVACVQLSQVSNSSENKSNSFAGFVSVILGCMTSGFAGVYFEMVLKSTSASVWLRNIQLSLIGIAMSLVSTLSLYLTILSNVAFRSLATSEIPQRSLHAASWLDTTPGSGE